MVFEMVLLMIFVLFVKRKSHAKTKLFYLLLFIFSFSIVHSFKKITSYKKSNFDISINFSLSVMMKFLLEMVIVIISSMEICLIRPLKSKHP